MNIKRSTAQKLKHLQCPRCHGALASAVRHVKCESCGARFERVDGDIIDFVTGNVTTQLDASEYDTFQGIVEERSTAYYEHTRDVLGERWPAALGSVLEIGCGTGLYSRGILAQAAVSDVILTDVSLDMLRICRNNLHRNGLLSRVPVTFASYSTMEQCFRPGSFDTAIGMQVLHHLPDVPRFLTELLGLLKPGARAFFAEPSLPFQRAVASALADLIAASLLAGQPLSADLQELQNWIAQQRLAILHQGDEEFLLELEDKHMFVGSEFEQNALRLGFATAEALPTDHDPSALQMVDGLMGQLRVSRGFADAVLGLLPRYAARHLGSLARQDLSPSYLFWLTAPTEKSGSDARSHEGPPAKYGTFARQTATFGSSPLRCAIIVATTRATHAMRVELQGWCLMTRDIKWLRLRFNSFCHDVPVWRPSPDVHMAFNKSRNYENWNSLCCRLLDKFEVPHALMPSGTFWCAVQVVLLDDEVIDLMAARPVTGGERLDVELGLN
jgi:2-polyprenyl-3-methyl-5-hydroxy-6-metoxy-1,4-benzoquinol methylase